MIMYYDRDGKPMEMMEWAKALEDGRRVKSTTLWMGSIWISTVWLGIDHDFSYFSLTEPNPHPIIFETLVFVRGMGDGPMLRYTTEAEAVAGHREMVRRYLNPVTALKEVWNNWRERKELLPWLIP